MSCIAFAKEEGAKVATGGKRASGPSVGEGWFVEPTIFTNVKNDMRIAREEVFGPVLTVIPFDTDDEAVQIANDTAYGLAAAIWTSSIERAVKLPKRLEAGHRLGQRLPRGQLSRALRRLQGLRPRSREWPGSDQGIPRSERASSSMAIRMWPTPS